MGSRIVEVHNGSSLFTGKAGQGPSNLRQYIIEQDLLEAIVALPEKMFYNTGIGTYLWVLSNKKSAQRKGKVQLIDATTMKAPLRKNLGEKNGEVNAALRKKILDLYLAFDKADPEYSKVFENHEFGYWQVTMQQPKRDENGKILLTKRAILSLTRSAAVTPRSFLLPTRAGSMPLFRTKYTPMRRMRL